METTTPDPTITPVGLGMIELPDHTYMVYIVNLSPEPLEEVQVISRGMFFEMDAPPIITRDSRIRRLGTIAPGEVARLEERDVGDLDFYAAYRVRYVRAGRREDYEFGTPPYNHLRFHASESRRLKTRAYLFTPE